MGFLLHYKIIPILAFCNHIIMIVEHIGISSVAIMIAIFTNISCSNPKIDGLSLYVRNTFMETFTVVHY